MFKNAMYQMRGTRVSPMYEDVIASKARNFCETVGLCKQGRIKKYDTAFELLAAYSITLNVMEDDEWEITTMDLTIGHCDPSTMTISVPKRIYEMACKGERVALSIMMHELGHLLLGHKPILHFSNLPPIQFEDAEWQADTFADVSLAYMGYKVDQLAFDFYM